MLGSTRETTKRVWRADAAEARARQVYLLLQHVSGELIHDLATVLKPASITPEQYQVLRILWSAGSAGIALSAIAERSPSGDPDVTRLLDRLERQGLATRTRETPDRRVVTARITGAGRRLLEKLDKRVSMLHARQFAELGEGSLRELRRLLDKLAMPAR
jgi:MarR family transcriptional regulator, organic hydroperoxide resistance regulator